MCRFSTVKGVGTPNSSIVQGSTIKGIVLAVLAAGLSLPMRLECAYLNLVLEEREV